MGLTRIGANATLGQPIPPPFQSHPGTKRMRASVRYGLVLCAVVPTLLGAQGFGIYEQGTCAMGRAGAGVAAPCSDGSAMFFNPAGLAGLTGGGGSGGGTRLGRPGGVPHARGSPRHRAPHPPPREPPPTSAVCAPGPPRRAAARKPRRRRGATTWGPPSRGTTGRAPGATFPPKRNSTSRAPPPFARSRPTPVGPADLAVGARTTPRAHRLICS